MKVRNRSNGTSTTTSATSTTARQRVDTSRLPLDAQTGQPRPPRAQPGYYQGFQTLSQQAYWDEATRKVVLARVELVPTIRFFSAYEAQLMRDICDRILYHEYLYA